MNKLVVFVCSAFFFSQLLVISSASACDKHVVGDATKKLLQTVPNLASAECARNVLKELAVGKPDAAASKCYQMTPSELELAKQIASEEETATALKNVFSS